MEKIYHEIVEKSGSKWKYNSPCVSVKAFRPNMSAEEGLPAIIVLESGKINSNGTPVFDHTEPFTIDWNHNGAELIRRAIQEFDTFRERVFAEVGGD